MGEDVLSVPVDAEAFGEVGVVDGLPVGDFLVDDGFGEFNDAGGALSGVVAVAETEEVDLRAYVLERGDERGEEHGLVVGVRDHEQHVLAREDREQCLVLADLEAGEETHGNSEEEDEGEPEVAEHILYNFEMLPRRGVKSGILQKSNSKTTVRPVFTESPAHYRQPVPLPVKAAHHPLPARSPYDIDRMYPLSSTSVARQGGREYGYASDRPDYPAPDRSRLHQPPTSSGQLSQNRSRHLDPESTRSFEAAVGMSSTDDLGTSDRGSRRPITSNSSQLIRTFSGEEAPPLAHTHMAESDVDFERTLVSLQSRMKNLQSKYLEMANYYRAELSKRKHGEAPETAAGAEMLQRLQE